MEKKKVGSAAMHIGKYDELYYSKNNLQANF